MEINTLSRIKQFIDFNKLTISSFEKDVNMSNGSFASQLKNGKTIGVDKLENILKKYIEINPEWLLTGHGEMLKSKVLDPELVVGHPKQGYDNKETVALPRVSVNAIGGVGNMAFSFSEGDIKEYINVPSFNRRKADFIIGVSGSSMRPKYSSGDLLACRIIKEQSFIEWNRPHIVATSDRGLIVKRIRKGCTDDTLLMVSEDPEYEPFEVPKNEINGIALVVGVIRLE